MLSYRSKTWPILVPGLAALWLSFRSSLFYDLFTAASAFSSADIEWLRIAFLMGFVFFLLACVVYGRMADAFFRRQDGSLLGVSLLASAGFSLLHMSTVFMGAPVVLGCCLSFCCGLCIGFLFAAYPMALCSLSRGSAIVVIVCTAFLNMLLTFAVSLFAQNGAFQAIVVLPFLSGACLLVFSRNGLVRRRAVETPDVSPPEDAYSLSEGSAFSAAFSRIPKLGRSVTQKRASEPARRVGASKRMRLQEPNLFKSMLLIALFLYGLNVLWGVMGLDKGGITGEMQIIACIQAAVISIVLLVCNRYSSVRGLINATEILAIICFFTGLFLTLMFSGVAHTAGLAIVMGSGFTLKTFAWITLLLYVDDGCRSVSSVFGIGIIVFEGLPLLLRDMLFIAIAFVEEDLPFTIDGQAITTAALFLLTIATVLLLGIDVRQKTNDSLSDAFGDDSVASVLGGRYHLTNREIDVALLLAKGNTQKKISDSLCVAPGTVQSHVKAVYRKLGVHSKQEIIDLINNLLP